MTFVSLDGDNTLSWLNVSIRHCSSWFYLMFFSPASDGFFHTHALINTLLSTWVSPSADFVVLSLHLSSLWYSAHLSLVALVPPYSQLCLLNSGRSPVSAWVLLPAPQPGELGEIIGFTSFLSLSQGSLSFTVWFPVTWTVLFRIFCLVSLIVSGRNINLVYLALSRLEVEICLFHFKMKKWCQDWELRDDLVL